MQLESMRNVANVAKPNIAKTDQTAQSMIKSLGCNRALHWIDIEIK